MAHPDKFFPMGDHPNDAHERIRRVIEAEFGDREKSIEEAEAKLRKKAKALRFAIAALRDGGNKQIADLIQEEFYEYL